MLFVISPYLEAREKWNIKRSRYIRVLLIMTIMILPEALLNSCEAVDRAFQGSQNTFVNTPVIKKNAVVFWAISQTDYDNLVSDKPELSERMDELWDYYQDSALLTPKLEALGFTVIDASWKEAIVQLGNGKTKKIQMSPEEFKVLILNGKGKEPKLVTKFSGDYWTMAKIISDYFGIEFSLFNRKQAVY
jgi:hypothetical protein